eukprot:4596834-Prymnesium_polylepis.1
MVKLELRTQKAADDSAVAQAEARVTEALRKEKSHTDDVLKINLTIEGIKQEANRLAMAAVASGDWSKVPHMFEIDDKSAVPLPAVPLDTTERAADTRHARPGRHRRCTANRMVVCGRGGVV